MPDCCSGAELTQNPAERAAGGKKAQIFQISSRFGLSEARGSEGSYSFSVLQGTGEHFSSWLGSRDAFVLFWIRAASHKAQLEAGMYPEPCSCCLYTQNVSMTNLPLLDWYLWRDPVQQGRTKSRKYISNSQGASPANTELQLTGSLCKISCSPVQPLEGFAPPWGAGS